MQALCAIDARFAVVGQECECAGQLLRKPNVVLIGQRDRRVGWQIGMTEKREVICGSAATRPGQNPNVVSTVVILRKLFELCAGSVG